MTERRPRDRTRQYGHFTLDIGGRTLHFQTQPGVFSQYGPDEGTLLLLDVILPRLKPHETVLDLGAGIGIIGIAVAGALTRGEVWMVDTDIRAARLSEENVRRNHIENAHVVLSDVTLDLPHKLRFDLALSNPPTHGGKDVLQSFVGEAYETLRPGGSLFVVVNRLLSIKAMMDETFGNVEQVERKKGFIVFQSQKERRERGVAAGP
ncbi:MAG TPA: methyltransferase [Chloroflexota bacterium]|nr:methyltransferase [Chloroflexota bacterium]